MSAQTPTDAAQPFCTIEWHGDRYERVVLYDGASLSQDQREELCWEQLGRAVAEAKTLTEVQGTVSRIATQNGLRAQWLEGGHSDPLRTTAAFTLWPAD